MLFFINFLNADFSSVATAYDTFFAFYGFELLGGFSKELLPKKGYSSAEAFFTDLNILFNDCKEEIIKLQNIFKKCVNYTYNLKDNNEHSEYTPLERFASFALRENFYKYSTKSQVYFNNLIGYRVELTRGYNSKLAEIRK